MPILISCALGALHVQVFRGVGGTITAIPNVQAAVLGSGSTKRDVKLSAVSVQNRPATRESFLRPLSAVSLASSEDRFAWHVANTCTSVQPVQIVEINWRMNISTRTFRLKAGSW